MGKSDGKASSLPDGLPASLERGAAGYQALCSLVGLEARTAKQAFAASQKVKGAKEVTSALKGRETTSKRLQSTILGFYRSANVRSHVWREASARAFSVEAGQPLSIEVPILSAYRAGLLTMPVDEDALAACVDLFEPGTVWERWQSPALVALPLIRRDVLAWQRHSEDKRRLLALACFAVASVLNQPRLIEWAAGRVPDLASEYEGLLALTPSPDETKPAGRATTRSSEPTLRASCEGLAAAVRQLLESPHLTESMFDEVARHASAVEGLRRRVLDGQDSAERGRLVDAVFEHIESQPDLIEKLGPETLPLLREHWEAVHLGLSPPDMEVLKSDVSRLTVELAHRMASWKRAEAKTEALWADLKARGRRDQRMIAVYSEQVDVSNRLWRDVEDLLSPTGHPFDFLKGPDEAAATHASSDEDERVRTEAPQGHDSSALPSAVSVTQSERRDEPSDDDKDVDETDELLAVGDGTAKASIDEQGTVDEGAESPSDQPVPKNPKETAVSNALWDALARKEAGVAYHIARLARASQRDEFTPPPALIAAFALAEHISSPEGELVESYAAQLAAVGSVAGREAAANDPLNLLAIAATLRPSLFAPGTGSVGMLGQAALSPPLKPIADAALRVSQRCARLQGMDIHRLQVSLDGGDFEARLDALADAVKGAAKDAELHRESFVPAQRIWKCWVTSGLIHHLVQNVAAANVAEVQQIVDLYRDQGLFADHVSETSASLRKGRRRDIDDRTVLSLRRSLDSMMKPATSWLHLAKGRGVVAAGFGQDAIADLKEELEDLRVRVSRTRQGMPDGPERSPLSVALDRVAGAASDVAGTFDQTHSDPWQDYVPARAVLTRELLLVPDIDLDLEYAIKDETLALSRLLDHQENVATLEDVFHTRLNNGDAAGASLVCDWMAARSDPREDDMRQELSVAVASLRDDVGTKVKRLVGEVEGAHAKGHIDINERHDLAARLSAPPGDSIQGAVGMAEACVEVASRLADARERSVAAVRREMGDLDQPPSEAERSAIDAALEAGNIAGAREAIYKLGTGEGIPDRTAKRDHLSSFLAASRDIETAFGGKERPSLDDIDRAAGDGGDVGGLSFADSSESEPPSELLAPWFELSRRGPAAERLVPEKDGDSDENAVRRIFENLGFVRVQVDMERDGATVAAASLSDRFQCPLHQYGSTASGKYRVLLNWRAPASDQLMQQATNGVDAVIALHFGHLRAERERLREWSLARRRPIIVLDETLVLYLSTIGPGRMSALFDCTLPFTCAEPFVTTASVVPPELFYGRAKERQDIMDRYGSCFVYGGRQIGKTALLRSVEAEFNRPTQGRIAKWIDLKQNAIGEARPPGDVWTVIWQELNDVRGESSDTPPQGRDALIGRLSGHIREWLSQSDDRQLLLLLDEADAFLEADSRQNDHFRESTALKGIMDNTQRQFKVVFCGLHNVLRTTARANHPLAHLGQPIGVGPLLSNGEWEEARNLLREPLAAIGCRFAGGEPVLYALAQTNYYPSLIQILGAELTRLARDRSGTPPYRVTVDDVASVFTGPARLAIREKFQLTLQLDERYEVIAYSMAFGFGRQSGDHARGMTVSSLLDDVSQWWKEGFLASGSDTTPMPLAEFEVLLDEMVELGVLRRVSGQGVEDSRYALRNPNILPLLGSDEEIEQALEKERDRPSPFDPASFRARRDSDDQRALLTSEQETKLLQRSGVFVVTGTEAAGITKAEGDLDFCVKQHDGRLKRIDSTDRTDFVRQLTSARPSTAGARDVYLVPADSPWGVPWLEGAVDVRSRVKRGERLRVVFIADPATLWRTMGDGDDLDRVDWFEAGPWSISFLRRWCDDLSLVADHSKVRSLMELSGGWPVVLDRLDRSPSKPWGKKVRELGDFIIEERSVLARSLGIDQVEVEQQVRQLLDYEGFEEADVADWEGDGAEEGAVRFPVETLRNRLRWARRLRLVTVDPVIQFNPLVKRVLQADA